MRAESAADRLDVWRQFRTLAGIQLSLALWCLIFFTQAHKEERFLFPVYPLIALSGAVTLYAIEVLLDRLLSGRGHVLSNLSYALPALVVTFFAVLALSRIVSVVRNYHAPFDVYSSLGEHLAADKTVNTTSKLGMPINVCVGKEWYR